MNKIRRHIPAFIDIDAGGWVEFSSTKELFELDFIKRHLKEGITFSQSAECLMIVFKNPSTFFVLGYLEHPVEGLPEWEQNRTGISLEELLK